MIGQLNNVIYREFPGGSDGKESACYAGDLGSIPGLGRSPGEGNGYPLQYSCLDNPMERGAWRHTRSHTTERITHTYRIYAQNYNRYPY